MVNNVRNIIKSKEVDFKIITYPNVLPSCPEEVITGSELAKYTNAKSSKRKLEIYHGSILWNHFSINEAIKYDGFGSPFIENGYISKSHSDFQVGIVHSSKYKFGLDLEALDEKIHRVKSRFLNESEIKTLDTFDTKTLTLIWSVKEATFKFLQLKGVFFNSMLIVTDLSEKDGKIQVTHPNLNIELHFRHWYSPDSKMIYTLVGEKDSFYVL